MGLLAVLIPLGPVSRVLTLDETPWNEYAYLSCLDCIAFGCLAAWLQQRAARKRKPGAALSGTLPNLGLLLGAAMMLFVLVARETVNDLGLIELGLPPSILALGTALVLWSLLEMAALRCSWLQVIGESSYEIYLTHMFVVLAAPGLFQASGSGLWWVFAFYAASVLGSVGLGWAVAGWYGQPLAAALRRYQLRSR
jgi:peptidoglycan/LPS O-acetylase OafA/YrhL